MSHGLGTGGKRWRRISSTLGLAIGYFEYYQRSRTHLSLDQDARPVPRAVHPPQLAKVVEFPQVGGLQHCYQRCAAELSVL